MKSVGWVDLTVEDAPGIRDFYARVMGWHPQPVDMGEYADFNMTDPATGAPAAGVCHARGSNQGIPPVWMVYFRVRDLERSLAEVEEAGGEIIQEPRRAGDSRYAMIRDPAGAYFALVEHRSQVDSGG